MMQCRASRGYLGVIRDTARTEATRTSRVRR
jgi:hypothetical protein